MKVRRNVSRPDTSAWPEFDPGALTSAPRKAFSARRRAVELFMAATSLAEIEAQTGVNRRQVYRSLESAAALHSDGRPYGWRALLPHTRVGDYRRLAKVRRHPVGLGTAGAFSLLLGAHPPFAQWISEQIRAKRVSVAQISTDDGLRVRVRSLTKLHLGFLDQCRAVGLTSADYPFNTDHMGIRSLAAAVRAECLRTFERGARLAGASHLKGLPSEARSVPAAQALNVAEFDGHRLDMRLKVVVRDPLGFEQEFEIERIWLLVIVDVWSRAVLGHHVSLNREYSRYDVIRSIENALAPRWQRICEMAKRIVDGIEVKPGSGNVFADLGLPNAHRLKIKSGLVIEITKATRKLGLTQVEAAIRMGIPQPKVSAMLRGDFTNLSERKLMDCLNRLGYDIEIKVKPARASLGHLVLSVA